MRPSQEDAASASSSRYVEVRFLGVALSLARGGEKVGGTQGPHAQPGTSLYTHSSVSVGNGEM